MALTGESQLGYSQLAVTTVVGLGTIPTGATRAQVVCETQGIRWRADGTDPTASVGMPVAAAAAPVTFAGDLSKYRIVSQTGTATVNVIFYSTRTP